jgi:FAD/FMN-containing dehydrogenase
VEFHSEMLQELEENKATNTMKMGQHGAVRKIWGVNEERMQRVKARYDPNNVMGSTIPLPASASASASAV